MNKIFTNETLMQYLYGLLEKEEMDMVEEALITNENLQSEFLALQSVKNALDLDEKYEPSQTSINIIMQYAEKKISDSLSAIY